MYPTISKSGSVNNKIRKLLDFLSFCDGKNSVLQIQYFTKLNTSDVREIMRELTNKKLIKNKEYPF